MPINIIRPAGLREEDLEKIEGMEQHNNDWHLLDFVDEDMIDVYKKAEYPELLRSRVKTMIRNNYPELEDEDTLLESLTALIYQIHVVDSSEFTPFARKDTQITVLYDNETIYNGTTTVDTNTVNVRVETAQSLTTVDVTQATGVTASASYSGGVISVELDDATTYTDTDIQNLISGVTEIERCVVYGQDAASSSSNWIDSITMSEVAGTTNAENVDADFIIKLDQKIDREDITDVNGQITTDLLDDVVYVYNINHPNYAPQEGEFNVETPYEVNIIYADVDKLGSVLEEQIELNVNFTMEYEDLRELGDVTVLDTNGNPVVGADAYVEHETDPTIFSGHYTTDDEGKFTFLALRNEPMVYEIIYEGVHSMGEIMHTSPYEYSINFINSNPQLEETNEISAGLTGLEYTT